MGESMMIKSDRAYDDIKATHEQVDSFKYRLARNKVLKNPNKMTFNPLVSALQYEYRVMLRETKVMTFLAQNKDAKWYLFFFLYVLFALNTLFCIYFIEYAKAL